MTFSSGTSHGLRTAPSDVIHTFAPSCSVSPRRSASTEITLPPARVVRVTPPHLSSYLRTGPPLRYCSNQRVKLLIPALVHVFHPLVGCVVCNPNRQLCSSCQPGINKTFQG